MGEDFKSKYTFEERIFESGKLRFKYPDRIPIVIKPNKNTPELDKHKYLVPGDINIGEFVNIIRKRIKVLKTLI
jgi:GABA(A) receptor-associated protein